MSTSGFYDEFISYQAASGINDRIFGLYKKLCSTGISAKTRILEIGCGIGTLTFLLSKKITKGKIEAVDISPKSIEFAKSQLKKENIQFTAADILDFEPKNLVFDKILLFDVLEHIPEENYEKVFAKIAHWMNSNSLLLINLPNPNYTVFDRENNPESLQEIDNPVFLTKLSDTLDKASLEINFFETYTVWVKNDYQFVTVKKKTPFAEEKPQRSFPEKVFLRLRRDLRKLIYNYPKK